jgi:hypothetical protein
MKTFDLTIGKRVRSFPLRFPRASLEQPPPTLNLQGITEVRIFAVGKILECHILGRGNPGMLSQVFLLEPILAFVMEPGNQRILVSFLVSVPLSLSLSLVI